MKILPCYLVFIKNKKYEYMFDEPLNMSMNIFVAFAIKYGQDKPSISLNELKIFRKFFNILTIYHRQNMLDIVATKINESLSFEDSSFD